MRGSARGKGCAAPSCPCPTVAASRPSPPGSAAGPLLELGGELRDARLKAGLLQRDVARALGCYTSSISRVEAGMGGSTRVDRLTRHAGAVGLTLRVKVYPDEGPLRDIGQLALLDRFRRRMGTAWRVRLEVPMPLDSDQRAWDMVLERDGLRVGVEAFTRLRDVQAQVRAAQLKRRESGVPRLVILLAASHANRRALADAWGVVGEAFPVGTRAALAALAAGQVPGDDCIVVM